MNKKVKRETPPNAEHENKTAIPVRTLQRYLIGELPEDELEALRALERDDADVRGQIAAQRALNAEILAQYPPAEMAAKYAKARANKSGLLDFLRKPARLREAVSLWNGKNLSRWAVPAFVCAAGLICISILLFSSIWRGVDGSVEKFASEDAIVREGLTIEPLYDAQGGDDSSNAVITPNP